MTRPRNPFPKQPGFSWRVLRAKTALRRLGQDCMANIFTRSFDNCFEMYDGKAVVWALMRACAEGDPLLERGIKNAGGSMWNDWLKLWQANQPPRDEALLPLDPTKASAI